MELPPKEQRRLDFVQSVRRPNFQLWPKILLQWDKFAQGVKHELQTTMREGMEGNRLSIVFKRGLLKIV